MPKRPERVASLLKQELGEILVREYGDLTAGFTTVTEVRLTPDLRIARVYVSVFGTQEVREKTMALLEAETPRIRSLIASRIRIRFIPELQFIQDDTLDRVDRINSLIRQIHRDENKSDDSGS
jgi:ribosome-binding factor A